MQEAMKTLMDTGTYQTRIYDADEVKTVETYFQEHDIFTVGTSDEGRACWDITVTKVSREPSVDKPVDFLKEMAIEPDKTS